MRVAILQAKGTPGDPAANLAALRAAALAAREEGADLLIAPEMWLTGYEIGAEATAALAEPADGPAATQAAAIAREAGIALLYGYPERAGAAVYNAALLLDAEGRTLANARKAHLYGAEERAAFTPGDQPFALARLGEITLGILICYDVEFPEAVRALTLAGAEIVAVPTALMDPQDWVARLLVPARAAENGIFLAYANRMGQEARLVYCGESCLVAPDGRDLARAGRDQTLLLAEIRPGDYARTRHESPYLRDRRPDLYGCLSDTDITPGGKA